MNDLISRQAAIDALTDDLSYYGNGDERAFGMSRAIGIIEKLPPAQPEKRTEERMETHACDCISRQMLLEYIHGEPVGRLLCDKYNLDGLIEQFPSAQPKWIPVTERLPKDIRPVIVTWCNTDPTSYYQHIVGKRFTGVAHYKSGKWYWYSSTTEDFLAEYGRYDGEEFDEAIEVLAWMPLPEPYKGEQE